ncbi:MAG: dTDP-glucose 4,6-dehydratase [Planctomycetota bacterium]|nr:dTDP-glucose 4,6-dehydratase [Planctomycetota bacterium]
MGAFSSILVTGGCGFIGSNFVRFVRRHRPDTAVINLDSLTYSGNAENLADLAQDTRYRFVHGDICDRPLVEKLAGECDAIVHFAAESHVDRSIMDAGPFIRTNVGGTQVLLDVLRARRAARGTSPRLLYVSTDEVYGSLPLDRPDLLFTEDSPILPNSPYAASKAAGDGLVRAYHHTFGLDLVTTRCSNNFGPYHFPEKVIPLFITNLIDGEQVPLYGDGLNVRDWLHVEDHCEAVLAVLERGTSGEVYNVGGNNERSNLDLTRTILRLMGKGDEMIRYVADRPGHDRRYAIDATKIRRELGWEPTRSAWPDALASTVEWYRANEAWWRRVKSGAYREYYHRQYTAREAPR